MREPGRASRQARQGFFPDGSRSFEEIDRFRSASTAGEPDLLPRDVDFYRGPPPSGFTKGLPAHLRKDKGRATSRPRCAARISIPISPIISRRRRRGRCWRKVTNDMQALSSSGDYDGVIWTQGSPQVEETAYWFNLLIDTTLPISGNAAQRPQGQISADGPKNIVDSVQLHLIAGLGRRTGP